MVLRRTNSVRTIRGRYRFAKLRNFRRFFVFASILIGIGAGIFVIQNSKKSYAASSPYTWDFSNSGDYTLSDSSNAEISSSTTRLKVQNYVNDSNTVALYHLDENTGTSLTDSSSNNNTATASGTSWATGNLNYALGFDGTSSGISSNDSASLSFTQAHTLETWAKLDSTFTSGSTSPAQRMALFDKGSYQLYFDNQTGKLTYEIEDSTANTWTQSAGNDKNSSWDLNGNPEVEAATAFGGNVYVGTGNATGDAEVWLWNGSVWSQIGGDGKNSGWTASTYEAVYSLANDGTYLYAGLGNTAGDAEVWRWNGSAWTKIGGDAVNSSWAVNTFEYVYNLEYFGGTLYAGLGITAGDAEVWSWNGSAWTKIGGDAVNSSWANSTYEMVYSFTNDGTNLYAGLGNTAGDAEVWRWNGSAWSLIGGDAVSSSWATNYESVLSLNYFSGNLYAGLGTSADDAEVWRWNGSSWSQVGGDSLNSGWTTGYEGVYSLTNDGTYLYAGLGASAGDNEVWRWNGSAWTKIGGDGLNSSFSNTHLTVPFLIMNGSTLVAGISTNSSTVSSQVWTWDGAAWTRIAGDHVNYSWGYRGMTVVQTMAVSGSYLYAGTGITYAGSAEVWRFDGSNWSLVGGQGINSSWTLGTYEAVLSMIDYIGNLYVGLGTTANDAEVWKWDGATWTKVGGDSINSGWTTNFEEVSTLVAYGPYLYAGLGNSAGDGEVWRYSDVSNSWTKIGGDGVNSSWNTVYERVSSSTVYKGELYVGLGASAGDAEVWKWNGSSWSKVGGDTLNSSWDSTFEQVDTITTYDGNLIVGLGNSTGDAEVWSYNGSTWSIIGGDDVNSSWTSGSYEEARSLTVYNGDLYAGLGNSAGDGEVWRYDGQTWTQTGGDNLNSGWTNVVEMVYSLITYKGKLYAGTGNSANVDANIWTYGDNAYLASTTSTFDTSWHHIAASYDGTTMKIYIDGTLDASTTASRTMSNNSHGLLIGIGYGSNDQGGTLARFKGALDEVRISNTARSSFTTAPYSASSVTVSNSIGRWSSLDGGGLGSYVSFSTNETLGNGTINYRLSSDGGTNWQYWNGSAWVNSLETSTQVNDAATISAHIADFPITDSGLRWQAVLDGDGTTNVILTSVTVTGTADNSNPTPPDTLNALDSNGGAVALVTNTWYSYTSPYFSWSGAGDTGGAGIAGYYVYFGTDNSSVPSTAGNYQTAASYTASGLTPNTTYYLLIQTKDKAQNLSTPYEAFIYKLDTSTPSTVSSITVSPSGYASTDSYLFSWTSVTDSTGAGLAGYQYQVNEVVNDADWSTTTTDTSVSLTNIAYQIGANKFYLRTVDNAGNYSAPLDKTFLFGGDGPSVPQFLSVTPDSNTENSFAFSWQAPATYSGSASELTYCYTINVLPSVNSCTFTAAGFTALSNGPYATSQGINTLYVVAKNPESSGGAINYANYASVTFTANTSAPGIPLNFDIADVSVKTTSSWKLALSWESPTDVGSGVSEYEIWHSTDGASYSKDASTTGIAYVGTGLTQATHYYKVRACDSVNNCGAFSTELSMLPTGKYTDAPELSAEPEVTNITTKKATISWSTDRASDSKVAYGTKSGDYFDEEPSNSNQLTDHVINMTNLKPGTKYYFQTKWTDEDGNTGYSEESYFETSPAPTVEDPKLKYIGINSVTISFTVKDASKVKIYYGTTSAFGGSLELSTSTSEATYNATIDELQDGTKYYYKINTLDIEDDEYDGNILSFETLPKPKISNVRIQQVKGTAQPTILISWLTNTEISSIVTYYPESAPSDARDQVDVAIKSGQHRMLIRGLLPETIYNLIVKGVDKGGNQATSETQKVTTATDTRPAQIANLRVEGSVNTVSGKNTIAKLVVSWDTDEPATSQVEFGEGTGTSYSQTSSEDTSLTYNHVVIISELTPSKVYHLRALSKDKAGNVATSIDTVSITPKSADNALNLVITNLQEAFGFLGNFKQK